jgi:putative transposase
MGRSRLQFGEVVFPHFLSCTGIGWLPVFTRSETVQIVLESWQFLPDQERLVLLGYVVLRRSRPRRCCDKSWNASTTTR